MKHMNKLEQLEAAYKKKNSKDIVRMLAVLMVLKESKELEYTTQTLYRCTNWVRKWVDRFNVDGLYDHPRSERPCVIPKKQMNSIMFKIMSTLFTPVMLQQTIFDSTGIKFHITHVRKIMRQYGMSAKTAQKYHINHASAIAVRSWAATHEKENSTPKKEWIHHCNA